MPAAGVAGHPVHALAQDLQVQHEVLGEDGAEPAAERPHRVPLVGEQRRRGVDVASPARRSRSAATDVRMASRTVSTRPGGGLTRHDVERHRPAGGELGAQGALEVGVAREPELGDDAQHRRPARPGALGDDRQRLEPGQGVLGEEGADDPPFRGREAG